MRIAGFAALGVIACVVLGSAPSFGAETPDARMTRILQRLPPSVLVRGRAPETSTLQAQMAAHHVPAVSIALVEDGRIVWAQAYGVADQASKRAATSETLFQAASISKPVTASAALQLVSQNRLDLDEPINRRLKNWQIATTPAGAGDDVTLRQLLAHTSGLTVHGFDGYEAGKPLPSLIQVLDGRPPANSPAVVLETRPGAAFSYSGGGYTVVQKAVADVTGEPFPVLMRRLVLGPLGMTSSGFEQPLAAGQSVNAATAYQADGAPYPEGFHLYPEHAAAGLWTTPTDLARWLIALQNSYRGDPGFLSQDMAKAMLTRGQGGWGLGLPVEERAGSKRFLHDGGNAGFRALMIGYLSSGQGVVIMTNGDDGLAVIKTVASGIAQDYGWVEDRPLVVDEVAIGDAALRELVGRYGADGITFTLVDERLQARFDGQTYDVVPQGGDRFIVTDPFAQRLKIVREAGEVTGLLVNGQLELPRLRE